MKNSNTKKDKQILHRTPKTKSGPPNKTNNLIKNGDSSLDKTPQKVKSKSVEAEQVRDKMKSEENSFEDEINKIKDLHIHHPSDEIINLAVSLHHQYELASIRHDWKTQKNCRNKPFKDLPIPNQKVMFDIAILINKDFERIRQKERDNLIKELDNILRFHNLGTHRGMVFPSELMDLRDKLKSQEKR